MLEAVRSADQGVGCDAVGSWHGVPSRPFGVSGTLHTSFGAVEDTPAGFPGLGTRVFSQVVADTLAGLPLEGCRVHVV